MFPVCNIRSPLILSRPTHIFRSCRRILRPVLQEHQSWSHVHHDPFCLVPEGYARYEGSCVNGQNIVLYTDKSPDECATLCDEYGINCEAFEYGVDYGGNGNYNARDCQLQSSADFNNCDGYDHNLDLYVKLDSGEGILK